MSWSAHPTRALLPAVLVAGLAAQEPPTVPAKSALVGWLQELLDGDVAAAIQTYDRGMLSSALDASQRALAAMRRLEIARLQGDGPTIQRCVLLIPESRAKFYQRRDRTPSATAELRRARTAGDPTRLAAARRRFISEMETDTSSLRAEWSLTLRDRGSIPRGPGGFDRPATPAAAEAAVPTQPSRIKLPLPPPANAENQLRLRASQIAELRLLDRDEEAGRLEADLVARLSVDGAQSPFVTSVSAEAETNGDAATKLEHRRRTLTELLATGQLTPREQGVLQEAASQLQRLQQADQLIEALQRWDSLPYELPGRG